MKNILICLERLDIGGVETFTIAQVKEYAKRGIKCYVLSQGGLLERKLKDLKNVELINFKFNIENRIDYEEIEKIEKLIKNKKIDSICIHQYPCIPYLLPLIFKYNIPYMAYIHSTVEGTFEWYMKTYPMYHVLFPMYFKNASQIVAVTEKTKKENSKLFNIDLSKYKVINNSLDFSEYEDLKINNNLKKINKFMYFGRLAVEKEKSIIAAIDFFKDYKEIINENATLKIVGDGALLESLKEEYECEYIKFTGAVADTIKELNKTDAVIGVDRCILEGIAAKRIAIISSYSGNISLVTPKIMEKEIEENFSGKSLDDNKKELTKYSKEELKEIIKTNYKMIENKLSISNSIITELEDKDMKIDPVELFKTFSKEQDIVNKLMENNYNLYQENIRIKNKLKVFVIIKNIVTLRFIRNKFKKKEND